MDTSTIGYWSKKKEELKKRFPVLSDEDLCFYNGKEQEMMEMLAYKLRKSKEELRLIIDGI